VGLLDHVKNTTPDGINSILSDKKVLKSFSHGQLLLLILCRAIFTQPHFIFMDDCICHLEEDQLKVFENILNVLNKDGQKPCTFICTAYG
jgi:ABC-type molybdenum transport system ATPase subunit/photorepair protein PhrA